MHAKAVQHLIEHKGNTRHVARVFQNGDGGKKYQKNRHIVEQGVGRINQPQAHGARVRVYQKTCFGQKPRYQLARIGQHGPDVGCQLVAPNNGNLVNQKHCHQQHQGRCPAVKHYGIDAVGYGALAAGCFVQHAIIQQGNNALVAAGYNMVAHFEPVLLLKRLAQAGNLLQQCLCLRACLCASLCVFLCVCLLRMFANQRNGLLVALQQFERKPGRWCLRGCACLLQLGAYVRDMRA